MYESTSNKWAHDALWADIRDALRADGIDAPQALMRSANPWDDWQNPDLLLSQTCGLPYRAQLHATLTLIAAPAIWVPDFVDRPAGKDPQQIPLPAGQYYSVLVARKDDTRRHFADFNQSRVAYNDPLSQSGWGLMAQLCAQENVTFASGLQTGAHRRSALAVHKSKADIAAIDVATWYGPMAEDRWTQDLRIVARTPLSPALPYVTAFPDLAEPLFKALKSATSYAHDGTQPEVFHDVLSIGPEGVVPVSHDDYMRIPLPPAPPPER